MLKKVTDKGGKSQSFLLLDKGMAELYVPHMRNTTEYLKDLGLRATGLKAGIEELERGGNASAMMVVLTEYLLPGSIVMTRKLKEARNVGDLAIPLVTAAGILDIVGGIGPMARRAEEGNVLGGIASKFLYNVGVHVIDDLFSLCKSKTLKGLN